MNWQYEINSILTIISFLFYTSAAYNLHEEKVCPVDIIYYGLFDAEITSHIAGKAVILRRWQSCRGWNTHLLIPTIGSSRRIPVHRDQCRASVRFPVVLPCVWLWRPGNTVLGSGSRLVRIPYPIHWHGNRMICHYTATERAWEGTWEREPEREKREKAWAWESLREAVAKVWQWTVSTVYAVATHNWDQSSGARAPHSRVPRGASRDYETVLFDRLADTQNTTPLIW